MKKQLLTVLFASAFGFSLSAQSPVCFTSPDGTDSNNWSYKDYVIPAGYKIDSVYMDADRSGYATSDYDFVMEYCAGLSAYNQSAATTFWNYQTDNNSEYKVWIDLTSYNCASTGMVRVSLPTVAGAVWNQLCFAISQSSNCFSNPDGTDSNNWSYKDYVIPAGYKIDSVYMDADRPGYTTSDYDYVLEYCAGLSAYNQGAATTFWNYQTDNSSEYKVWIDLTSYNCASPGVVRVSLPTVAGAVWNQLCFTVSQTTGIKNITSQPAFITYPNPAQDFILINGTESSNKPITATLTDLTGRIIMEVSEENNTLKMDLSGIPNGLYLLRINDSTTKVQISK